MEYFSENLYQTPKSDVSQSNMSAGVNNFERFSAWGVFGLSIITLGMYSIYWLYTRSGTLNSFYDHKISRVLLNFFLASVIVSITITVIATIQEGSASAEMWAALDALMNFIYVILYLIVLFTFRGRLQEMTGVNVNLVLTFFGAVIYLQYKINKCIDTGDSH